jgi:signal transduction histidine kinase
MFLNQLFPKDFIKDSLLYFSALLTWGLVSFIYLKSAEINVQSIWQASALVFFIFLFFNNISHKKSRFYFSLIITVEVSLLLALIYFDHYQIIPILFALVASQLPAHFQRKQAMLILLIVNFAYYFTLITAHPQQSIYTVLIFFTLQVFAFSVIEATLKEQRAKEEIGAINQELLATRFMLKESSKKQERLRISRDLHDVLGHQLTALALNLEVTQHKLPNEYKPLAEENLQQAKQLLQGVRNVVKEMRTQEKLDLRSHLNNLFTQLPNCQFAIKSNLKKNSVEIDSLTLNNQLIFCLQEAISNALRHGKANDFTLKFYRDKNHLTFELTDNGKGCNEIIAGNGLKGMQERLSEFNGKIELLTQTNTTTSGCTLRIQVEDNYD